MTQRSIVFSIEAEYRRYRSLAEAAMAQLSEPELSTPGPNDGNSVAVIAWHVAGNLASRFTDFLTTDGEKPWRNREQEFASRSPTREELREHWDRGWAILFESLAGLSDDDLDRIVTIRRAEHKVYAALYRSLAHASYHVGQIVYLAKSRRGHEWQFLSIPPGGSDAYNENPDIDRPEAHVSKIADTWAKPDRS